MIDLDFYSAGCQPRKGLKHTIVPLRRVARRLLKPLFQRQLEILQKLVAADQVLEGRIDQLKDESHRAIELLRRDHETVLAFGWDYAAMARRLAVLEDRVELLTQQQERGGHVACTQPAAKVA